MSALKLLTQLLLVPRNVVDACARCGDAMTEYLRQLHEDDFLWIEREEELNEIAEESPADFLLLHLAAL